MLLNFERLLTPLTFKINTCMMILIVLSVYIFPQIILDS